MIQKTEAATSKIPWARPLGALFFATLVLCFHAAHYDVPLWADTAAPAMLATWYISRELWKYVVGRKLPL